MGYTLIGDIEVNEQNDNDNDNKGDNKKFMIT